MEFLSSEGPLMSSSLPLRQKKKQKKGAAARGRPHYDDACLACLCKAVGKGGACRVDTRVRCLFLDALGLFCITRPFWLDGGRPVLPGDHPDLPGAFQRCVEEPFCAIRTVQGYMDLGNGIGDCDNNGVVDCRDLVLTHVYGRYSCVDKPEDKRVIRMMECLKASGHRDALSPRPSPATTPAATPATTPTATPTTTTPTSTPTPSPTPRAPGTTPRLAGFFFNTTNSTYTSSYATSYGYLHPEHVRGAPGNGYRSSDNSHGASDNVYGASNNVYGAPKNVNGVPDKVYGVPRSEYSGLNNEFGRYSNPYGSLDKGYSAPNNAYGRLGRSNHPAGPSMRLSAPRRSFDSLSPCVDCRSADGADSADPEEIMSRLPKMTHGRLVT